MKNLIRKTNISRKLGTIFRLTLTNGALNSSKRVFLVTLVLTLGFLLSLTTAPIVSAQNGNTNQDNDTQVVAVVNGDKITATQLAQRARINTVLQQVRPIPEYYQFLLTTEEGRSSLEHYQKFILERMIEEELQLQKAKEKGFEVTEKEIEDTIQQIIDSREDVENLEQLKERLKEQESSMDSLKEQLREDILLSKLKQDVVGSIEITMGEIREFYEDNPDYFKDEEGKVKPFDQIKSNIAEIVKQNKANKAWSDWMQKVKEEADIERKLSQSEE